MGFLEEIVRETHRSVSSSDYGADVPPRPTRSVPSFRHAVEADRDRGSLVVEFKRVSPGQREPVLPTRSVEQFVELTSRAGASALSCLATSARFEGSPQDVAALARSSSRPVLFKDFVLDERQIEIAARTGASAVLLIARLATDGLLTVPLSSLAEAAHRRDLEVVLEFHAGSELSCAEGVAADVYGVNTRDLDTLTLDRSTARETIRKARRRGMRPLLGLSGVETATDAQLLWDEGVDGLLVGSAVARASDPEGFLATLRKPSSGRRP
jgi:indole-3-glycerol phosphate synthase